MEGLRLLRHGSMKKDGLKPDAAFSALNVVSWLSEQTDPNETATEYKAAEKKVIPECLQPAHVTKLRNAVTFSYGGWAL